MNQEQKMYTLTELAKILNVTKRTLATYIKKGTLKAQMIGGSWIVSETNYKRFLNGEA